MLFCTTDEEQNSAAGSDAVDMSGVQFCAVYHIWNQSPLDKVTIALSKMQLTCEQHGFVQCSAVSHSSDQNALEQVAIACS